MSERFSYSKVSCYEQCPYKYKLRYLDKLQTYPSQDADNPLYLGSAIHIGIECGEKEMLNDYMANYYVTDTKQEIEKYKLKKRLSQTLDILPKNGLHEIKVESNKFIGFIDYLVPVGESEGKKVYDLYDFKYCNAKNADKYKNSAQIMLYKYYFEKFNPDSVIRDMYYTIIPKVSIRQKKTEKLFEFYKRLDDELRLKTPYTLQVEYNEDLVEQFITTCEQIHNDTEFVKNESRLCHWCEYENYCTTGDDLDIMRKES